MKQIQIIPAVLTVTGLVILGGCTIKPPAAIPPVVFGDRYTEQDNKQRSISTEIKVLSMDYCVQMALKNNPDGLSKQAAINAAWARYYQSFSSYAPSINASTGFNANTTMAAHQPDYTNYGWNVQGSASMLLFNGLTREMNVLAAQHGTRQAEHLNSDARRLLIQAVGTAYNTIQASREEIRIEEQNRDYQRRLLKQAQAKYDAGTSAQSDVYNFEIRLYEVENALIAARASERTGRFALAQLMGLTTASIPDSISFPGIEDKSYYILSNVNIYLDAALRNRPDLKSYREALKIQEYKLYSIYGEYSPTVSANATIGANSGYTTGHTPAGARRGNSHGGNVSWGVTADWNLFNGFNTWNRIREAQSVLEQNHYAVATQWIKVVTEVRQAHENYRRYEAQLSVAEKKLDLVRKTRDLVDDQYKAGTVEVVRVNEAQRDVVDAETQVANLKILIVQAKIQLESATGLSL